MIKASAYILNVPANRRKIILRRIDEYRSASFSHAAEPVPKFSHSKRSSLVVLASFEDEILTHVADGRKGASAGTDLVRLNISNLERLREPIAFEDLIPLVPTRLRSSLRRVSTDGGLLPPKTLGAVVDALVNYDPNLAPRLSRFSEGRSLALSILSREEKENLAVQKETLGISLEIAGISRDEVLAWSPSGERPNSFLEGLPSARVREDAMIISDFTNVPGFTSLQAATHFAAITFEKSEDPDIRLTVIMANRLPLEQQTGADLIYYNEAYRAFVMVQYKAMEHQQGGPEFRWQEDDQLVEEIARMDVLMTELAKCPTDKDPDGFRLNSNPFFLKFCSRVVFNPDDKGLFSGIYLPLDLWKGLNTGGKLKGPKGGNVLSFDNVGRRLTNTEFAMLVANSWVGTTIPQSLVLEKVIRSVLESGKTVTFAMKHKPKAPEDTTPDSDGLSIE